ncbi:MAG: fumarylacetoacetase [Candidatus Eisenbacteria bacterium]
MDTTTDPKIRSFISADKESHFPIQNIPFGVFRRKQGGAVRAGTRVGDTVVDLAALADAGIFDRAAGDLRGAFAAPTLNRFLALGRPAWREAREILSRVLRDDDPSVRDDEKLRKGALLGPGDVEMILPVDIGDYTDFYSSREHATNVGTMFRGKENALMPNWVHIPIAYHGRASSVVVDGTPVRRPRGQTKPADADAPAYGPCRLLDFELETAFFVGGPPNPIGEPLSTAEARERIFGVVLMNDWSARDIQAWEYQPLGPFTAKNFATSVSPWIVTLDALEPFRCPGPKQDPEPLPYLRSGEDCGYDVRLEVFLRGESMEEPHRICNSNFKHLYWSMCQQLAHHTVTGCNIRAGDLMGSGTISAPDEGGYGSLLELTWRGTKTIVFPNGEECTFLRDGDTVTMTGWCQGDGYKIGFGEVRGKILPAHTD